MCGCADASGFGVMRPLLLESGLGTYNHGMSQSELHPATDFDPFHDPRPNYRLCLWAFRLGAVALGIQAAVLALGVVLNFSGDKSLMPLRALVQSATWDWYVGTPLTWGAALSSWLLVGRFAERGWNARALLLSLMNSFDVLLWLHQHAAALQVSFAIPYMNDEWARRGVGVLQWFELYLFAGLAAQTSAGVGFRATSDVARAARGTAVFGLMVWMFAFFSLSSLRFGWARRVDRRFVVEMLLMWEMAATLLAITAFQATVVCMMTARACRTHLAHLKAERDDDALFGPRNASFDDRRDEDPWR